MTCLMRRMWQKCLQAETLRRSDGQTASTSVPLGAQSHQVRSRITLLERRGHVLMDSQLMERVPLHEHPSPPASTSGHWPDEQKTHPAGPHPRSRSVNEAAAVLNEQCREVGHAAPVTGTHCRSPRPPAADARPQPVSLGDARTSWLSRTLPSLCCLVLGVEGSSSVCTVQRSSC